MTIRIRDAYRAEMGSLAWMTPATKRTAVAKLDAMGLKVGYPDRWRSYAGFDVRPGAFLADLARGRAFERRYQLAQIGKPLDRQRWGMTPQTVNAYNDTQRNEIVLPAAQLQRPFFDAAADDASNLGATGAGTVGHEMTHGFDDEGHKFDLHGNVRNWWTTRDLRQFDARANCVIKQFDSTVAVGTTHYQGRLVAGEAIADLGGTVLGYRALETSLAGKSHDPVDGFTPEQRYFLAFAQSWTEERAARVGQDPGPDRPAPDPARPGQPDRRQRARVVHRLQLHPASQARLRRVVSSSLDGRSRARDALRAIAALAIGLATLGAAPGGRRRHRGPSDAGDRAAAARDGGGARGRSCCRRRCAFRHRMRGRATRRRSWPTTCARPGAR